MRKQQFEIILIASLLISLSSCSDHDQNTIQHTSSITTAELTSDTTSETTCLTTTSNTEASTIMSEESLTKEGLSKVEYWNIDPDADWCKAYVKYIEEEIPKWSDDYNIGDELSYTLIYLDDNDIPELYIFFNIESDGEMAVTYHDGEISSCHFSRHFSYYVEKSGYVYTHTGNMGCYPMKISKRQTMRLQK